jgi:secondary thiamine-phosphate synthase enzyme
VGLSDFAQAELPAESDCRHHRGDEEDGDAHLRNLLVHHQVIVPVTNGRLDLGPWQAVFSCEFDGGRSKRLVIKVLGE